MSQNLFVYIGYMRKPPKPAKKHTTAQIFDLLFKHLIRLSPPAVISFINGLFGSQHSPSSSLAYPSTESVSSKLRRLLSDSLLLIDGTHAYHIETQISEDPQIALRVFEYGFAEGLRTQSFTEDLLSVKFPAARIIYLKPTGRTPDTVSLRLEFPAGGEYLYTVKTFKFLDHTVEELEARNMGILLPFYVLKLREAVEAAASGEQRRVLSREMKGLIERLTEAVDRSERRGVLSEQDARTVIEHTERLFRELYMGYSEFKESNIMLQERILTYSEEAALKAEKKGRREGRQEGLREGRKEGRQEGSRLTRLETARKMKKLKLPADQIAAVTGLSPAEIEAL
jgi:predicted transposase/invertase (TIGR01784 family)